MTLPAQVLRQSFRNPYGTLLSFCRHRSIWECAVLELVFQILFFSHLLSLYLLPFHFLFSSYMQNEQIRYSLFFPQHLVIQVLNVTHSFPPLFFFFLNYSLFLFFSLRASFTAFLLLSFSVGYSFISVVAVFYVINVHLMGNCVNSVLCKRNSDVQKLE